MSFTFASRAFEDDNRLTAIDRRSDYGKIRYVTLARIEKRVYVLVYTLRNTVIRLISARKAQYKRGKTL